LKASLKRGTKWKKKKKVREEEKGRKTGNRARGLLGPGEFRGASGGSMWGGGNGKSRKKISGRKKGDLVKGLKLNID